MIEKIILALVTQLGSYLISAVLKSRAKKQEAPANPEEVDRRLADVKAAYTEAFDGKPITPEQRKKINLALSAFINGGHGL
jgi:hypothetical protein